MGVTGSDMAWRIHAYTLPYVNAYGEGVLGTLLPAFGDLERRANEIADAEFQRLGSEPAGENCDGDMSGAAEAAKAKGLVFYETMSALRQTALNLFAAGLFHLVEQHLAELCRDGAFLTPPPRDSKLAVVSDWYRRHFELDLHALESWSAIDELRLLANAVKHGEGTSAHQLRERRPELFEHPLTRVVWPGAPPVDTPLRLPLAGDDLYVSEGHFREYHNAAVRFVRDVAAHFEAHEGEHYPRGG